MCLDAGEMEDIYTRNTVQYFHAIFILIAFLVASRAAPNLLPSTHTQKVQLFLIINCASKMFLYYGAKG